MAVTSAAGTEPYTQEVNDHSEAGLRNLKWTGGNCYNNIFPALEIFKTKRTLGTYKDLS